MLFFGEVFEVKSPTVQSVIVAVMTVHTRGRLSDLSMYANRQNLPPNTVSSASIPASLRLLSKDAISRVVFEVTGVKNNKQSFTDVHAASAIRVHPRYSLNKQCHGVLHFAKQGTLLYLGRRYRLRESFDF